MDSCRGTTKVLKPSRTVPRATSLHKASSVPPAGLLLNSASGPSDRTRVERGLMSTQWLKLPGQGVVASTAAGRGNPWSSQSDEPRAGQAECDVYYRHQRLTSLCLSLSLKKALLIARRCSGVAKPWVSSRDRQVARDRRASPWLPVRWSLDTRSRCLISPLQGLPVAVLEF
jgi:hypothetical protein